jgi:ADP-ribose pyrophosphatase
MQDPPEAPNVTLEVVGDRTATSKCDEGYLRVRRLDLRARWRDTNDPSESFAYDVVERWNADAVAVLAHFERDGVRHVVLRSSVRPPVAVRGAKYVESATSIPSDAKRGVLWEIVAGLVERDERSDEGLVRCAVRETAEEIGVAVDPKDVRALGGPIFPSAGVIGELIYFYECEIDLGTRREPDGDGSPLERNARIVDVPLDRALAWCDEGLLPDAKTEIALRRFAARIGKRVVSHGKSR